MKNTPVTIGSVSADKAMSKLRDTLTLPAIKIERFTIEAEKSLLSQPIVVTIPGSKLGKTVTIISEDATATLLKQAESVSPVGNVAYMNNIPANELADVPLNLLFVSASKDQQTIGHLINALAIAPNIKANSTAGKIDYSLLDAEMIAALPAGKKLSNYIKNVRKHPVKKILGITTRSAKKVGGDDNV